MDAGEPALGAGAMTDIRRYKNAPGVFSKYNKTLAAETDGEITRTFHVEFWWAPPGGKAKRFSQRAGTTLEEAKELKARIEKLKTDPSWTPPGYRRQLERERRAERDRQRIPLQFERAVTVFLEARAADYAYASREIGAVFSNLKTFFGNRHMDEIAHRDIARYKTARSKGIGPFRDRRPAAIEIVRQELLQLSAVFDHLRERGFDVVNPCLATEESAGDGPIAR